MSKDTLRKILISGIFLIPFIALVNIDSLAFPFITGKAFIFRIMIEILAGIWVLLMIVEKKYRPRFNGLSFTLLAFLVIIMIADIFGANPLKSLWGNFERMDGLIGLVHLIFYFIIVGTTIDTEKLWARLLNTTIGVSVVMSLLALVQLGGGMQISTADGRLDSTIGNAAYFALYLLMHIFLAIFILTKKWTAAKQSNQSVSKSIYLYLVIIIFETIIMYFTATRGAMLGLIGGIFIIAILIAIFTREQKKMRMIAVGAIAFVILVIGTFFAVKNQPFVINNPILNRFNAISIQGFQNQSRYFIWSLAISGIKERPLLGWGQENFNIVFNKHYEPALYNESINFDRAHNIVLDWLVSGGVLGLIAYLSVFASALYYLWVNKNQTWSPVEKCVLIGLMAGYFINNLFVFDSITSYILFFTILAYIYSQTKTVIVSEKDIADTTRKPKKDRRHESEKKELIGVFIVPILIVIGGIIYFLNVKAISAAYHMKLAYFAKDIVLPTGVDDFKIAYSQGSYGTEEVIQAMIIAAQNIRYSPDFEEDIRQDFYNLAVNKLRDQIQNTPQNAYDDYLLGSLFYTYGNFDNAITSLDRAVELSPKKQLYLSKLADVYIAKKDYPKAYIYAKKSFDLESRYDIARMTYAVATMLNVDVAFSNVSTVSENIAASSKILVERYGTDLIFNQNLMSAYAATNQIDEKVEINAGAKQKISPVIPSERLSGNKILIDVSYKDTEYKIYKSVGK